MNTDDLDEVRCPNEACEGIGWYNVHGERKTCPDCNGTGTVTKSRHEAIVRSEQALRLDIATGFSLTPEQLREATDGSTGEAGTDRVTYDVQVAETRGPLIKVAGTAEVYKHGSIVDTIRQESWVANRPDVVKTIRSDMLTRLVALVSINDEQREG